MKRLTPTYKEVNSASTCPPYLSPSAQACTAADDTGL